MTLPHGRGLPAWIAAIAVVALFGPAAPADAAELPSITARYTVGSGPNSVAIAPNGARIISSNGTGNSASVIVRSSGLITAVPVGSSPQGAAITPNGVEAYVTNNGANTVSVITMASAVVNKTIGVGTSPGKAAFTGNGSTALIPNGGANTISKIDVASQVGAGTITGPGLDGIGCLTPNADGTRFFACLEGGVKSIGTFTASDASVSSLGQGGCSWAVFAPNGTLYASCTNLSRVVQVASPFTAVTNTLTLTSTPGAIAINPAGTRLFVAGTSPSTVTAIEPGGGVLATTAITGTPSFIDVSDGGEYVLVTTTEGNLVVLNSTGTQVLTTIALGGTPSDLEVARSGDFAAVSLSSTNEVVTIGLPRSDSGTGASSSLPTGPLQQYVPASGEVCGTNPPGSVDFPGLGGLRNQGWGASWAQWPNGGRGGTVCSREPFLTPSGQWAVR